MVSEIGFSCIEKIEFSREKDMTEPYGMNSEMYIDLSIYGKNNTIHICGKNDWGYLIADAIKPLIKYANDVLKRVDGAIENSRYIPEVIMLGKNEYRAVDILHRINGERDPVRVYKRIPVVRSEDNSRIDILGIRMKQDIEYPLFS